MSGTDPQTTNNRMELTGVVEGLRLLLPSGPVYVITTSDYVFMGATRWIHGWKRRDWKKRDGQPVSNQDLWKQIDSLVDQYEIRWLNGKGQPEGLSQGLEEAALLATQALEMER